MRICTEIYKSSAEIYVEQKRADSCGEKDAEEDAVDEEDSQNQLR